MVAWIGDTLVESGRLPLFLCFFAFVVTFATTRTITRLIRSGRGPFHDNVAKSGVHVHHAVPGIIVLTAGAFLSVGIVDSTAWESVAGMMVGVGTSLVLDEFALILRLDDVYWSKEGRISVELVALAAACLGLLLVGSNPFRVDRDNGLAALIVSIVAIVMHLAFVAISVAKGKYRMALFGAFVPTLGFFSSVRLARPDSRWAKKRYDEAKIERARTRAAQHDARWNPLLSRVSNAVAGAPTETT